MKTRDLLKRIHLGEDGSLELKEVLVKGLKFKAPRRDDFADELGAFANSDGGTLVLGVDDKTNQVVGIPRSARKIIEKTVTEICNDSISPPLDARIVFHEVSLKSGMHDHEQSSPMVILEVSVDQSMYLHESPGGYYRRIGSSKRRIDSLSLQRVMMRRAHSDFTTFDKSPVPRTEPKHLNRSLARRFVDREGNLDLAARKIGLIVRDARGDERLSVGSVLMCTKKPEERIHSAYIQAVFYAGSRVDDYYQIDARDIGGPLDRQVSDAFDFVIRNMRIGAVKRLGRHDVPQYSERAIFEALVNAVAHRDYSIDGSRIRLHMFSDRIELYVPGSLANTLTPDVLHLLQVTRNPLVTSLLSRCPSRPEYQRRRLMDGRGDGVPRILSDTERLSGRLPEYSVIGDRELRLVVPAAHPSRS